jgi:hypothetical protein
MAKLLTKRDTRHRAQQIAIGEYVSSGDDGLSYTKLIDALKNDDYETFKFCFWEPMETESWENMARIIQDRFEAEFQRLEAIRLKQHKIYKAIENFAEMLNVYENSGIKENGRPSAFLNSLTAAREAVLSH